MKGVFVYITVLLLFCTGGVYAGQEGGLGAQPYAPSGSDSQAGSPGPDRPKGGGAISGDDYAREKEPRQEAGRPSYRQRRPNDPVRSRWQVEGGGFIGIEGGRRR